MRLSIIFVLETLRFVYYFLSHREAGFGTLPWATLASDKNLLVHARDPTDGLDLYCFSHVTSFFCAFAPLFTGSSTRVLTAEGQPEVCSLRPSHSDPRGKSELYFSRSDCASDQCRCICAHTGWLFFGIRVSLFSWVTSCVSCHTS